MPVLHRDPPSSDPTAVGDASARRRAMLACARLRHPVLWFTAGIITMAAVIVGGMLVDAHPTWSDAEFRVDQFLNAGSTSFVGVTALVFDMMLSTVVAVILLAIAVLVVALFADVATATVFLGCPVLAWLASSVLSVAVNRPPIDMDIPNPLVAAAPWSYPSTPTALGTAVVIGLVMVTRGSGWRQAAIAVGTASLMLTMAARLFLGVAYPSDVVAGALVGAAAAAIYFSVVLNLVLPRRRRARAVSNLSRPTIRGRRAPTPPRATATPSRARPSRRPPPPR